MNVKHKQAIYELIQNTENFCGNTLEAMKEYCAENNLDWKDFEDTRLNALNDFYDRERKP